MKLTDNAMVVLREAILLPGETPEQMLERVAKTVACGDHVLEDRFFWMMDNLYFLPNSPCLMNAGTNIGQLEACFVLPIEDSIEGIFGSLMNMAIIQKSGGGTGFSFSRLRPENDVVNSTQGVASGPVSFMRIYNCTTEEIKQGGRRRGANLAVLRVDHPDIIKFITCKMEPGFDNFNISVGITNEFMDAVANNELYELINPRNGEVVDKLNAAEVFGMIIECAWTTGEPGVIFLDTINAFNPTPKLGEIEALNPCGETNLLPYESCNLGSINLSKMIADNGKINWELLKNVVWIAIEFLDNVIDVTKYPLPEIEIMTKKNRKIGLGVMGWGDFLYQQCIPYDSDEACKLAETVMKFINSEAIRASETLAKRKGPFPNFEESVFKVPRRNAAVTSIAPTGTLSIIANTTPGIEPVYGLSYSNTVLDGKKLYEFNPIFLKELMSWKNEKEIIDILQEIQNNKGSIQNINGLPAYMKSVFKTAHDISPYWHVRMQATFQKYTEQSISKTINLPNGATKKDVKDAFLLAYKLGCKGITVYRDGSRRNQVFITEAKNTPAKCST